MVRKEKMILLQGIAGLAAFAVWTWLVQTVDVQQAGQAGAAVGFAAWNCFVHGALGVHMWLYTLTDWLGLVPVAVATGFGIIGAVQLIKRKSLLKVDLDLIILGLYYVVVIWCYLGFEMFPVNYRPILIEGRMEASYPSSTTLLVLCVMPTLVFQVRRRVKHSFIPKITAASAMAFSVFTVVGRLISGVHWLTDIIGSVLLSAGLFNIYRFLARERYHGVS